jgi:hypothetical protein
LRQKELIRAFSTDTGRLRVVCTALDNDPEKIGKHMLEILARFISEDLME